MIRSNNRNKLKESKKKNNYKKDMNKFKDNKEL